MQVNSMKLYYAWDIKTLMSESNLKNVVHNICGDKVIMSGEDIKKFVFHDSAVHEQTLNEYFDRIGMKNEENVNFDDFVNRIKKNCKLKEKYEGKVKVKKQESRYEFKGPVIVEDEEKVEDEDGENSPRKRYKIGQEGEINSWKKYKEDENEKENGA